MCRLFVSYLRVHHQPVSNDMDMLDLGSVTTLAYKCYPPPHPSLCDVVFKMRSPLALSYPTLDINISIGLSSFAEADIMAARVRAAASRRKGLRASSDP